MISHWKRRRMLIAKSVGRVTAGIVRAVRNTIIHITDAVARSARFVDFTYLPARTGNGEPSPENVRMLNGRESVKIYHSGADTSNPQMINMVFSDLMVRLPAEYQEVQYIEATGTQYIQTNYEPTETDLAEAYIYISQPPNNATWTVFSAGNASDTIQWVYIVGKATANELRVWTRYFGSTVPTIALAFSNIGPFPGWLRARSGTGTAQAASITALTTNNSAWGSTPSEAQLTSNKTLRVMGRIGNTSAGFVGRMRSFTVSRGDEIVLNLIPCYRKADDEIGMYDLVSGTFYANAGTGEFIKGPNPDAKYGGTVTMHSDGSVDLDITHGVITMTGNTTASDVTGMAFKNKGGSTVNHEYITGINGGLSKQYSGGSAAINSKGCVCSHAPTVMDNGVAYDSVKFFTWYDASSSSVAHYQPRLIFPLDSGIDTIAKANAWLAEQYSNGTPVQYTYWLKEPEHYHFNNVGHLTMFEGENKIWTDDNNAEVSYFANDYSDLLDNAEVILLDNVISASGVKQGGCTDGEYIYQTSGDSGSYTYMDIIKYKISDGSVAVTRFSGTPNLGHGNDIAYNPNNRYIYVCTMLTDGSVVIIDSSDMSYVDTKILVDENGDPVQTYQLCFNRNDNCFYAVHALTCYVYDSNLTYLRSFPVPSLGNTTAQNWDTDGHYFYRITYSPNNIQVLTMDGEYVTTIAVDVSYEPEAIMYDWNGRFYLSTYISGNRAILRMYQLELFEA